MTSPAELVDELRRLIEVVRTTDLEEAADHGVSLAGLAERVATLRTELAPHVVDDLRMQRALRGNAHFSSAERMPGLASMSPQEFFPYSPIIGTLNPVAPGVHLHVEGDRVVGGGRVGAAFNGPPGSVHGGHVAALMDELLGCVCLANDRGGFTGTLTVRYERTTPLDTDLELEGWIDRVEGRKTVAVGEIRAGGQVCARGEGIFIRPRSAEELAAESSTEGDGR